MQKNALVVGSRVLCVFVNNTNAVLYASLTRSHFFVCVMLLTLLLKIKHECSEIYCNIFCATMEKRKYKQSILNVNK